LSESLSLVAVPTENRAAQFFRISSQQGIFRVCIGNQIVRVVRSKKDTLGGRFIIRILRSLGENQAPVGASKPRYPFGKGKSTSFRSSENARRSTPNVHTPTTRVSRLPNHELPFSRKAELKIVYQKTQQKLRSTTQNKKKKTQKRKKQKKKQKETETKNKKNKKNKKIAIPRLHAGLFRFNIHSARVRNDRGFGRTSRHRSKSCAMCAKRSPKHQTSWARLFRGARIRRIAERLRSSTHTRGQEIDTMFHSTNYRRGGGADQDSYRRRETSMHDTDDFTRNDRW